MNCPPHLKMLLLYLVIANCINCAAKLNRSCIASTKKWIVKMFIFVLIYDWSNATNSLQYPPRSMCWNSAQYKFSESGMDVCIGNGQLTRYASWLQLLHMLNVFFIGKTKPDFVHWKVAKLHPRMPKTNYRWKLLFLAFHNVYMPYIQCDDFKGAVNKFVNTYAKLSSDFNIPKIIKINLFLPFAACCNRTTYRPTLCLP